MIYTEVVTVGTGRQFATVNEAYDAVSTGGAIAVYPGIYHFPSTLNINKKVDIIGMSEDISQVVFYGATSNPRRLSLSFSSHADCLIEGIEFRVIPGVDIELGCIQWTTHGNQKLLFNGCRFFSETSVYGMIYSGARFADGSHPIITFTHCDFVGQGHSGAFRWVQANLVKVIKSQRNIDLGFQVRGSWLEDDTVTSSTMGYDPDFALTQAKEPISILAKGRVIDETHQIHVRVVVFYWHYPPRHLARKAGHDGQWQAHVRRGWQYGVYYQGVGMKPRIEGPYLSDEAPT